MVEYTGRLKLAKPAVAGEVVDVAIFNANMDKIDEMINAFVCTSTTRPPAPYQGMFIYETDTEALYVRVATRWAWVAGGEGSASTHAVTTPVKSGWRATCLRKRISDEALIFEAMVFPTSTGNAFGPNAVFNDVADGWVDTTDYPDWTRTDTVGTTGFASSFMVNGVLSGAGANQTFHASVGTKGEIGIRVQAAVTLNTSHRFYVGPVILSKQG